MAEIVAYSNYIYRFSLHRDANTICILYALFLTVFVLEDRKYIPYLSPQDCRDQKQKTTRQIRHCLQDYVHTWTVLSIGQTFFTFRPATYFKQNR
jgi:hypothetical protein